MLLLLAWSGRAPAPSAAWLLGLGLLSMPALHGLVRGWTPPLLDWFGRFVFPIYLFNTICIGLAKAALLPLLGWSSATFAPFAAILLAAGLFGPIAIAKISARAAPAVQRQLIV